MAFSMHSHSGQFCPGHAKDQLEEVIQCAISQGMRLFALTEHMPRNDNKDLYPEEVESNSTIAEFLPRHEAYLKEAVRLKEKYKDQIKIIIGFEGEWIRPSYANLIHELMQDPDTEFFIGSVHHVHEIPIDYDHTMYNQARAAAGGTDERLFEDYFDSQYEMLQMLKPRVVGHFDLIRLLSDEPNRSLQDWEGVWAKVIRNLKLIHEQGGLVEINASGLRKGLNEPYPARPICEEFIKLGGRFTLSDDSHGIVQVGTNFQRALAYLESIGVETLYHLEPSASGITNEALAVTAVPLTEITI